MTNNFSQSKNKLPSHYAYTVNEGRDHKSHWQKIGAAWPAKDDGMTLKIDSVPLNGEIILRSREALERMRAERNHQQGQQHNQNHNHKPAMN